MKLQKVPIVSISQDPANVRRHGERNLQAIVDSLRAFGQQTPIVVDERGIILKGNGTFEAAKRLGWDSIGVVRTSLKGTDATAYAIADNRTSELAEWDLPALGKQLKALGSEGFAIDTLAFDPSYLTFADDLDLNGTGLGTGEGETLEPEPDGLGTSEKPGYDSRSIKQIILLYETEQFELVIEALADYGEKHGITSNSEAIVHLIEHNGYSVTPRL